MLFLVFSVLLIAKATLGEIDCDTHLIEVCDARDQNQGIPRDVSAFNNYCVSMKSQLRCLKDWQDECGAENRVVFFETPEIFEATFETFSDICEEGSLLNTIATENLICLNETFERTRCTEESGRFVEPYIREVNENEGSEPRFSIFCLRNVLVYDCVLRAISDNCGQLVGETALLALRRSKSIENACSVKGAQSVLDELPNVDMSEERKRSVIQLLEEIVEE